MTRPGFFEYCESLGFFQAMQGALPENFFILFELARHLPMTGGIHEELDAMARDAGEEQAAASVEIPANRVVRMAPAGESMDIGRMRSMAEVKNLMPGELLLDEDAFDRRLMGKGLLVRRFTEASGDRFLPVIPRKKGGEQSLYILLDRSRSMEKNMRSLYSRYIIAEYLRRKRGAGATIFFRPFDSFPGALVKAGGNRGMAELLFAVLSAESGGSGTNIQGALMQAARDMRSAREMTRCEILLVTDCAGMIDRAETRRALGDIRLNIVKIGDEYAAPLYSEIRDVMERSGITLDSPGTTLHDMMRSLGKEDPSGLSPSGKDALRFARSFMKDVYEDLRAVSDRFIETGDLDPGSLHGPSPRDIEHLISLGERLGEEARPPLEPREGRVLYAKASFLSQYARVVQKGDISCNGRLSTLRDDLRRLMDLLLRDAAVLHQVAGMEVAAGEKKWITAAGVNMRERGRAAEEDILRKRRILLRMGFILPGGGAAARPGLLDALATWFIGAVKRVIRSFSRSGK